MAKNYNRGKKRGGEILSLRDDDKVGKVTRGIFLRVTPLTRHNGEPVKGSFDQELQVLEMADIETGEEMKYWADGGIRGQLNLSKVETDAPIEIEHMGAGKYIADDGKAYNIQKYTIYDLQAQ